MQTVLMNALAAIAAIVVGWLIYRDVQQYLSTKRTGGTQPRNTTEEYIRAMQGKGSQPERPRDHLSTWFMAARAVICLLVLIFLYPAIPLFSSIMLFYLAYHQAKLAYLSYEEE